MSEESLIGGFSEQTVKSVVRKSLLLYSDEERDNANLKMIAKDVSQCMNAMMNVETIKFKGSDIKNSVIEILNELDLAKSDSKRLKRTDVDHAGSGSELLKKKKKKKIESGEPKEDNKKRTKPAKRTPSSKKAKLNAKDEECNRLKALYRLAGKTSAVVVNKELSNIDEVEQTSFLKCVLRDKFDLDVSQSSMLTLKKFNEIKAAIEQKQELEELDQSIVLSPSKKRSRRTTSVLRKEDIVTDSGGSELDESSNEDEQPSSAEEDHDDAGHHHKIEKEELDKNDPSSASDDDLYNDLYADDDDDDDSNS